MAVGRFDIRADLGCVTCPSLVISGDRDPIMPTAFSDMITASLQASPVTRVALKNAAHLPQFDDPQVYFAAVRAFIERILSHG